MRNILLILYVFSSFTCLSQKQGSIWYFGKHTGLNFNNGSPVVLTNGQTYSIDGTPVEGSAVISDSSGSLLFYTNGMKIWNKFHQVMPNGNNILGNFSSTQAALIVPQPNSSRYFYVFTTDCFQNNLQYGLRYSVVDMCLNNGLGDVIDTLKNIKLTDTVAEKLTAVKHANGKDYWILTHKYYSDAFYAFHLSSTGIIDTVVSHIGSRHPNISAYQGTVAAIGCLKASPNGQKIAIVNGNAGTYAIAEYFDFNKNNGIISNWVNLQTNLALQQQYYGVSFSPDNSKLYIACSLNYQGIYQFDLNAGNGNQDSIISSRTNIANNNFGFNGLQLANNGKIYLTPRGINLYLAVINCPNNSGTNCCFQDSVIYLNGDTCGYGLPNFIDSYDYSNNTYNCDSGIEEQEQNNETIIYPNPSSGEFKITNCNYQISKIEIYDMFGKKIYETKNLYQNTVNLNLPNSIYFAHIICKEGTVVKKIVIQQ